MACLALLMTLSLGMNEPDDAAVQQRAETAFAEGVRLRDKPNLARAHFRQAAREYDTLRQRGCTHPDLYLAQGNAYFLADDVPRAILAYRRGLRLDPAHGELQTHLQAARLRVSQSTTSDLGRPPTDNRPPWLPRLRLTLWTALPLILLYSASCLLILRWAILRRWPWLAGGITGLLLSLGTSVLFYLDARAEQKERATPLVVLADEGVLLRVGNGLTYPPKYESPLPRGTEARLRHQRGDWVQIELSDGKRGWVPSEYVLIDRD